MQSYSQLLFIIHILMTFSTSRISFDQSSVSQITESSSDVSDSIEVIVGEILTPDLLEKIHKISSLRQHPPRELKFISPKEWSAMSKYIKLMNRKKLQKQNKKNDQMNKRPPTPHYIKLITEKERLSASTQDPRLILSTNLTQQQRPSHNRNQKRQINYNLA